MTPLQTFSERVTKLSGRAFDFKAAVDRGHVYFLSYPGHAEPDPLGTPVDRCARIAKLARKNTLLASGEFADSLRPAQRKSWNPLGIAELRGLGATEVFQYGDATIRLSDDPPALPNISAFIATMVELWEQDITVAWDTIHTSDAAAVGNLALELDSFFEEYHGIIDKLVNSRVRDDDLKNDIMNAENVAQAKAREGWRIAVDSLYTQLSHASTGTSSRPLVDEFGRQMRAIKKIRGDENDVALKKYRELGPRMKEALTPLSASPA